MQGKVLDTQLANIEKKTGKGLDELAKQDLKSLKQREKPRLRIILKCHSSSIRSIEINNKGDYTLELNSINHLYQGFIRTNSVYPLLSDARE